MGEDLTIFFIVGALQDEVFPPGQFTAADKKDLHTGVAIGSGKRDHIRIHAAGGDDFLLFDHFFDGVDLVPQSSGLLILHGI